MTALITGGTGKVGRRLAALFEASGVPFRVAARGAPGRFDWNDASTWDAALDGVSAAYLIAPANAADAGATLIAFVERAQARGCGRFVLQSGSVAPAGGPLMGQAHAWLMRHAEAWAVLRPTWFMDNFSEARHLASIRAENAIYSAAEDGRAPFISADDIAACAFAALMAPAPPNADFVLTSSRALSHDESAELISRAVGRTIVHRRIDVDALAERFQAGGLPPALARLVALGDRWIAAGAEDRTTDDVERLTGRPPASFEDFVVANTRAWAA